MKAPVMGDPYIGRALYCVLHMAFEEFETRLEASVREVAECYATSPLLLDFYIGIVGAVAVAVEDGIAILFSHNGTRV
jgi:hypothetical protein